MCSASRALVVIAVLGLSSSGARAQAPTIPSGQPAPAPPSGNAEPAPDATATGAPAEPPFTAPPVPSFTPPPSAPPAAPGYGGAPVPGYVGAPAPGYGPAPPPGYGAGPAQPAWSGAPAPGVYAPGGAPPPVYASPPAPSERPPRDVRLASAHADRVVFLPTAETHPAGTWFITDYEIILPQVGVAVSDRTQIALALTGTPGAKDPIALGDLSVKSVLARGYRYRLAATGSITGLLGFDQGFGIFGRAGFVAEMCFDDTCRSSVNLGANLGFLGSAIVVGDGAGFVLQASELVSILVEGQTVVPLGEGAEEAHGVGGALGVRLARERWGLDFAVEGFTRGRNENRIPPIPLIVFTYRFLP